MVDISKAQVLVVVADQDCAQQVRAQINSRVVCTYVQAGWKEISGVLKKEPGIKAVVFATVNADEDIIKNPIRYIFKTFPHPVFVFTTKPRSLARLQDNFSNQPLVRFFDAKSEAIGPVNGFLSGKRLLPEIQAAIAEAEKKETEEGQPTDKETTEVGYEVLVVNGTQAIYDAVVKRLEKLNRNWLPVIQTGAVNEMLSKNPIKAIVFAGTELATVLFILRQIPTTRRADLRFHLITAGSLPYGKLRTVVPEILIYDLDLIEPLTVFPARKFATFLEADLSPRTTVEQSTSNQAMLVT